MKEKEKINLDEPEQETPLAEKPAKPLSPEAGLPERSQEILDDIKEKSEISNAESMLDKANEGIDLEASDVKTIDEVTGFSKDYSSNVEATQRLNAKAFESIESVVNETDEAKETDNFSYDLDFELPSVELEIPKKGKLLEKEKSPLSELGLSKIEKHQAEKRMGKSWEMGNPGQEMKRVKFFQENPELRQTITSDPFSEESKDAYFKGVVPTETFTEVNYHSDEYKVLKGAILAEPKGVYEEAFKQLPRKEQAEKLYEQIDTSAEMTMRIQKYIDENIEDVNSLSDGELHNKLSEIAFGTENEDEIQSQYALSQRRGFRLSIANFLEGRKRLENYKDESQENPKAFAEKYLKENFSGNVTVEELPMGFVIYMDEQDYALVESDDKDPKSIPSKGVTLSWSSLPKELQGKFVVMNRGGKETGVKTEEELESTRKHEIRHILFDDFHSQQNEITSFDTKMDLASCKTEKDYKNLSEVVYGDFVEKAKDEIIAYFSQGNLNESYSALRFDQYNKHIKEARIAIEQRDDLPTEQKNKLLESFEKDQEKCFDTIRKMRFVAEKLAEQSDKGLLDHDKAEALLRNTPGVKIDRLSRYIDVPADEIKSGEAVKEQDKEVIGEFSDLTNDVPKRYDDKWWEKASQSKDKMRKQLSPESLPALLQAIPKWSEKEWTSFFAEEAVLLTKDFVDVHGVSKVEKSRIQEVLNGLIAEKSGDKKFAETVKFAQDLLGKVEKIDERSYDLEVPKKGEASGAGAIPEAVSLEAKTEHGVWERSGSGVWEFLEAEEQTYTPTTQTPEVKKAQPPTESKSLKKEEIKKQKSKGFFGKVYDFFFK